MSLEFHVLIPARYQSSRLPGKLLMELNGMTVIERVYHQAMKAKPASIIIATDSQDIYDASTSFGANVVMTATSHQSGTDRIAEVVAKGNFAANDIIVNVQGDEPFINPILISQVAESLTNTHAPMATLCWPIDDEMMSRNPNVVKVVRDSENNALYFSRSPIPAYRDKPDPKSMFRHIGLYAYRASFLLRIVQNPVCEIEAAEALEQLRVLWAGYKIKVEQACAEPLQDINTEEDLIHARALSS